ncbi:MAG: hypothetical protein J1F16_04475 [Muribaculaceae bacterium]|nr:hypothetical protein [Muribaculaceae bacterium]
MKKLLVHLHLYYHDQVDYFIEKMGNITLADWDLVVTYTQKNDDVEEKLKKFKPDVILRATKNIGYDIWPFIEVIRDTNLDDYEYVMKLHTKRSTPPVKINVVPMEGFMWRETLVNSLLENKEHFTKLIDKFDSNPKLGMASSLLTYTRRDKFDEYVGKELSLLGLKKRAKYTFMGSMFLMRAQALKPLQGEMVYEAKFRDVTPESGIVISMTHIYERLLSSLPVNYGLKHLPVLPEKEFKNKIHATRMGEKISQFFLLIERRGVESKKYIRVFGIKVYESKTGKYPEYRKILEKLYPNG